MKFGTKIIALAGILIFLTSMTRAQIKDTVSGETRVNTETAENQKEPDIAIDSSGNYIIVWESKDQDGDAEGIYAQRFNSAGDTVGPEFRVNVNTANAQKKPAIAMNDIGEYVIVWDSKDQDGDKEGIYAQYYEPDHSIREPEFLVNTVTVDKQMNPDVAIDNSGVFVVVWESNNSGAAKKDVYAQLFDDTGQPQGNEIQVNTFTANDQKNPAVGMNSNTGEFVVVWQSKNQNGAVNKEEIYAQRFDNTGTKIGVEFLVNVTISDVQKDPAICMDTSKFIIAWVSDGQDGDGRGIYAQIHDNTGGVLRAEFLINTETTDDQDKPSIGCSDCAGGFNIVWESMGQDGDDKGVYAKVFDASGNAVSAEFRVNTDTIDIQEKPVVTSTVRDTFIVAWQSDQVGDQDVYKQRYIYSAACNALRVNAGPNAVICSGDSIVIGGSPSLPTAFSGTPPYTYSWTPADSLNYDTISNPTASPTVTTIYVVTVTDNNDSVKTDTVTIIVDFVLPVANITPSDSISFCPGDSVELISDAANSYQWLLNGINTWWITKSIIVFSAGDYQVVVKNSCGIDTSTIVTITDTCSETCSDGIQNQDETSVDCGGTICPACPEETCNDNIQNQDETGVDCGGVCDPCAVLNIPSVFTPNSDGTNDKWIIRGTEPYPGILIEVYNRWGSPIFSSPAGYPVEWNGKNVPDGVYYYIITLGNGQEPRTGTVTIVR